MSDLLNQASLVYIPSGYKEDTAYSVIPTDGSGDLTFTRASDGTRVNSQGLVERVPWNLLQQSNTFSTTWVSGGPGGTVTSGQTDPDGGSNAWLLSKLGLTGRIEQTINVGGVQTFFIYAKKNTSDFILINVYDGTTSHECWFNLSTGVVGSQNVATGAIESVGNGWYKCSVTSTNLFASGIIQLYQSEANGVVSGTTGSIYIFNAQLNEGSTAKPYFPTTDRLNVPRLDYSGGCPSLLLEPQRTNLVTYSEQFDGTGWSSQATNIVSNATTSPDGTTSADAIIEQNTTGEHNRYTYPATTAAVYTASVFLKKYNATWCALYIFNPITGKGIRHWINLDTLTAGTSANIGIGISAPMTLEDYGNGWVRASITFTADVTEWRFYIGNAQSNGGATSYTGDGTSGLYAWGAQLEAGSYATSYIPTTSASVTRVADAASKTGISSLIGQTEGTIFVDFQLNQTPSDINGRLLQLWETNDTTNSIIPIIYQSLQLQITMFGANVGSPVIPAGASTLLGLGQNKIAIAYTSASVVVYRNGVLFASGNPTGFFPTSLTSLDLGGSSFATRNLSNPINQAAIFKTRLTNAELAALTTL